MKIAVDASNSVGAMEIDRLEKYLPQIKFIKLNWQLDGRFPGHAPNPFVEKNRGRLSAGVRKNKADFGVIFDGDADRVYFLDDKGDYLFGVYINGLIARKMCLEHPGRAVIGDIRARRYLEKKVKDAGGIFLLELVGHAFFKKRMKEENAVFGAESSGHIYYNFGDYMIENSLIAIIQIMQIISESGQKLSELMREPRIKYPVSGEWNFSLPGFANIDDLTSEAFKTMHRVLNQIRRKCADAKISDFDTLTVQYPDWNFNLRPSANDPVLRFTAEANNVKLLLTKQKEVIAFLKTVGCQYINDSGVKQLK